MKFFTGFILGLVIGVAAYWFVETRPQTHGSNAAAGASSTGGISDALRAKLDALDLRTDQIKDELARSGKIARRKAQDIGSEISDAASDARIVAAIKAKFAVDQDLSVWDISVSCTQGHVTLSGTVPTPDDIGKAMALAMEPDGVRDVISTIRAKGNG